MPPYDARRRAARRRDARPRRHRRDGRGARRLPRHAGADRHDFGRPGYLRRAVQAGVDGFLVKNTPATQLADAVRRVHAGLRVVDASHALDSIVAGESPLTPRETDVLRAARDGASVAVVARRVSLSEGTVRNHRSAAIGKTEAANRAEAARIAEDNGWLQELFARQAPAIGWRLGLRPIRSCLLGVSGADRSVLGAEGAFRSRSTGDRRPRPQPTVGAGR